MCVCMCLCVCYDLFLESTSFYYSDKLSMDGMGCEGLAELQRFW